MKVNLRSVDLNLLTIFDALVQEQNISRAAEKLGMSQPAVSSALQRLRLTFKDELFIRSAAGMIPTPRARTIHDKVQESLSLIAAAISTESDFDPASEEREFTLLADDYLEMVSFGPLLAQLAQLGSGLSLYNKVPDKLDFGSALRRLEADAAIHFSLPEDMDKLEGERISEEPLVAVCRQQHPRIDNELDASRYFDEAHVSLIRSDQEKSLLEKALGRGVSVERKVKLYIHSFTAMASVVSHTDTIGTMPITIAQALAPAYRLKSFPLPLDINTIPVWLMWPSALNSDSGHRWFMQFLRDNSAANSLSE